MRIEVIRIGTLHTVTKANSKKDLLLAKDLLNDRKRMIMLCTKIIEDSSRDPIKTARILATEVVAEGEASANKAIEKINNEIETIDKWISTKTFKNWFLALIGW